MDVLWIDCRCFIVAVSVAILIAALFLFPSSIWLRLQQLQCTLIDHIQLFFLSKLVCRCKNYSERTRVTVCCSFFVEFYPAVPQLSADPDDPIDFAIRLPTVPLHVVSSKKERKNCPCTCRAMDDFLDLDLDPPWSYFDGSSRDHFGFSSFFDFSPRRGSGFVDGGCFVLLNCNGQIDKWTTIVCRLSQWVTTLRGVLKRYRRVRWQWYWLFPTYLLLKIDDPVEIIGRDWNY